MNLPASIGGHQRACTWAEARVVLAQLGILGRLSARSERGHHIAWIRPSWLLGSTALSLQPLQGALAFSLIKLRRRHLSSIDATGKLSYGTPAPPLLARLAARWLVQRPGSVQPIPYS